MSVIGKHDDIDHGTLRGYRQHRYRKVTTCEECKAAHREDQAERRETEQKRFASEAQAAWYGGQFQHRDGPSKARALSSPDVPLPEGTIRGRDLQEGDVIVHLGAEHPVDRFEPYKGSLLNELGDGTRIARSGEWGMTIGPNAAIRILPRTHPAMATTCTGPEQASQLAAAHTSQDPKDQT
jgi:hypothetical protein